MKTLGALYFHGEQLIPIFLGVLLLSVAILAFLSWALVRYFKPRMGRSAYFMAVIPFMLVFVALFVEFERAKPNQGSPKIVAANRIAALIKALPQFAHFSLSGLSFFQGQLYVGTNLGIVEVSGRATTRLYQFQSEDAVVSGPWLDKADKLLWAIDDHAHGLLRFDGVTWTRMRMPLPAKGYFTRGDVLEGVKPIGNSAGFWIASGGTAWKWDSSSLKWLKIVESTPPSNDKDYRGLNDVIGVLPVGPTPLLIVRHQTLAFMVKPDEDFLSDELVDPADPTSTPIRRDGKPFLADTWTATEDASYICTKDQNLIRVTNVNVVPLEAPGSCEAVSIDDDSNLLVSIASKGIFRYAEGKWMLLAESPYPSGAGKYWTFISASSGQLAVAIDGQPVIDRQRLSASDIHFFQNAPTSLWVLKDGKFAAVSF